MSAEDIDGVVNWELQKRDFERDGTLRDIYVLDTTFEHWRVVLELILGGAFGARLDRLGGEVRIPNALATLFDGNDRHLLTFSIGGLEIDCHFFRPEDIEFSFAPEAVTEPVLRGLLSFMTRIGDAVGKPVVLTPENGPHLPIFRYEPTGQRLVWNPC